MVLTANGAFAENIKKIFFRRKKMRKFKKLIPAFAMLLVSAIMLGSSTFAWFSMNNKVTAGGMEVTARSNAQYLVISKSTDFANSPKSITFTKNRTVETTISGGLTDEAGKATNEVYPCKFVTSETTIGEYTAAKNSFYTANSDDPNKVGTEADANVVNAKEVDVGKNEYMLTYTMYISLAAGSEKYNGELKVNATIGGSGAAVIRVGDTGELIELTNSADGISLGTVSIEDGQTIKVIVYVYIDGTNADVFTNTTKTTITGTLLLEFTATDIAA